LQAELSALQSTSASATTDHDAALQEYHNKLESTRTELVSTINDKAEKIDQLESTVLDLRTSREELLLEGEIRADELKVQLARAVDDSEALRTAHTAEVEAVRGELAAVKSTASQLPALQNEFTKIDDLRLAATKALEESMAATHEREAELAKSRKLAEQRSTELETLRSETAIRRALEGDQAKLEAMLVGEREGRRMAEKDNRDLVEQLGELRELRELRKAWLQEKKDLEARLDTASATTEEQRGLIESLTSRLDETAINHADAENAAKELQVKLRVSEQALHILTSEVYRLQMDLSTKTAESANRIISLESQVMAETSRSQMLNESKTALETSMVEKSSSLASAQAEIQKLQSFIATSSTSSTEQTALIASVEEQVRIEAGARKSSDEVRIALDEEVVDLRAAVEGHETEVGRLCKDSETARRKIEDLRREIQEARSAKEALGAELASTVIVAKDQRTEVERLVGELSVSRARLEEMERQLADTRVQLDAARQGRSDAEKALHSSASERGDKIKALSAEVVTLKARAEAKDAALLALKTVSDDDQSARQRLEGEIAQLRTERAQIEKTLGEDYAALQDCLDASTKEVGGIKAELEVANAERVRLQAQLDSTAKQGDGKVKEANEIVTSLRAQLRDTEVQIGDVESRLEAEVDSKMGVEKQLKAITADRAQIEAKVKHIEEQLAARQKAFDDQRSQLSTVTTDLKSRSAALAVAEQSATSVIEEKRQLFANLATIVDENTMHRSALTACQTQLDQTLADLAASNNASKKLSEDLAIARATEAATRPRHASTPTGSHAGTGVLDSLRIQALRSATTGEGGLIQEKLKTKEKSEIEKLEKIIEAQKEVIDDQREKIKFWAKVSLF
jgi:centromeric protein E